MKRLFACKKKLFPQELHFHTSLGILICENLKEKEIDPYVLSAKTSSSRPELN